MPKHIVDAEVALQRQMARDTYLLTFTAPKIAHDAAPGNFLMLNVPDDAHVLRRPLGVADVDLTKGTVSCVYKIIGDGTRKLAALTSGATVNVMGPLGNGFTLAPKRPLLVGGGMGLAPLLYYAKCVEGADVLMGGRTAADMFWTTLFKPYVKNMFLTTDDGTMGEKGFAVALLPELLKKGDYDYVLTVGPTVMMKATAEIATKHSLPCQVSLENRMGCGLGACLSCAVTLTDGTQKKVCTDGPIFEAEEVWS